MSVSDGQARKEEAYVDKVVGSVHLRRESIPAVRGGWADTPNIDKDDGDEGEECRNEGEPRHQAVFCRVDISHLGSGTFLTASILRERPGVHQL